MIEINKFEYHSDEWKQWIALEHKWTIYWSILNDNINESILSILLSTSIYDILGYVPDDWDSSWRSNQDIWDDFNKKKTYIPEIKEHINRIKWNTTL